MRDVVLPTTMTGSYPKPSGYDDALSIEHEDPLIYLEEGFEQAVKLQVDSIAWSSPESSAKVSQREVAFLSGYGTHFVNGLDLQFLV